MKNFSFHLLLIISYGTVVTSARGASQLQLPASTDLPAWVKASAPELPPGAPSIKSGELELVHSPDKFGDFMVQVDGQPFATGHNHPQIGYLKEGALHWVDLAAATEKKCSAQTANGLLSVNFLGQDSQGATWNISQEFRPADITNAIETHVRVSVDKDRAVVFLPMFLVFPGANSFGAAKGQGLFAGLEYLENEPSSSEADVIGPASKRQVPDNLKITFPLMAIEQNDHYLALTWQMRPQFSAVFDSPDRLFNSGGHVMGLLFPGSNGKNRIDGSLLPKSAEMLLANQSIVLSAVLMGGRGKSVVPAVEQYVRLHGLPPQPVQRLELAQYAQQAADGWMKSKIREGSLIRHAVAQGGFKPQPAADAAVWMEWLALNIQDSEIAAPLRETAKHVLDAVPVGELNFAAVGHIRYPIPALLLGNVAENADKAEQVGKSVLARFKPDGTVEYEPQPGGTDYGKTHFSREATGFTSATVRNLLEAATFSGDTQLLEEGLKALRAMGKFKDGVPRGAQTWECPLHTPDILAAAHMVRTFVLGYELTGDKELLEQARYWAWTGVPFVYLVNPTGHAIGLYSTIAVFGATQWKAPVWLGLPVQWCGLVYADSLYRLVQHDPSGPWKRLADGITLSGIQQSWSADNQDLQGLLPDSFALRDQRRNGPAINPATVQACAVRYFGKPVYDFHCFLKSRIRVHAPGAIVGPAETDQAISFRVESWSNRLYYVLINGLARRPQLRIDGNVVECSSPHQFMERPGRLILQLKGNQEISLAL